MNGECENLSKEGTKRKWNECKKSELMIQRKGDVNTERKLESMKRVCLELSCTAYRGNLQKSRICWEGKQQRNREINCIE